MINKSQLLPQQPCHTVNKPFAVRCSWILNIKQRNNNVVVASFFIRISKGKTRDLAFFFTIISNFLLSEEDSGSILIVFYNIIIHYWFHYCFPVRHFSLFFPFVISGRFWRYSIINIRQTEISGYRITYDHHYYHSFFFYKWHQGIQASVTFCKGMKTEDFFLQKIRNKYQNIL